MSNPEPLEGEPSLYGDKPIFTYIPKDGGEPIVFPAHSTILGEVHGKTYWEMLWEFDEDNVSGPDQIFTYLRRSGASREMKRRVMRLPDDEINVFFRSWFNADDETPTPGLPPES